MYRLAKELEFPVIIAGLSDNCLINCLSLTVFSLGIGLASMESSTLAVVSQTNPSLIQVNLCQKLMFLHQPTHNMTTYCSLNYKFNT